LLLFYIIIPEKEEFFIGWFFANAVGVYIAGEASVHSNGLDIFFWGFWLNDGAVLFREGEVHLLFLHMGKVEFNIFKFKRVFSGIIFIYFIILILDKKEVFIFSSTGDSQ
jgi:hypothetical protein